MRTTLLVIILLCFYVTQAYAAGQVWLSATPSGGDAAVLIQGSPGGSTTLSCAIGGSWLINVHYTLNDGGATGWALDFYGNTPFVGVSNLNVVSQGFGVGIQSGSVPNAGGVLLRDQSGQNLNVGGQGPGDFILETFTLSTSTCIFSVWAGIGGVEFGGNDPDGLGGFYEIVQIGSNVPRPGYSNGGGDPMGAEPIPLIPYPEPTTLSLLFLASLMLGQRTRQ